MSCCEDFVTEFICRLGILPEQGDGIGEGVITSGGFSPTLERSIAMARIPAGHYDRAKVEVRNRLLDVRVVRMPFVRNGKAQIDIQGDKS